VGALSSQKSLDFGIEPALLGCDFDLWVQIYGYGCGF
jgi:hypothetical protein